MSPTTAHCFCFNFKMDFVSFLLFPAICQFSLATRLERLNHLSIYVSIYVTARSHTPSQIQFQPLLLLLPLFLLLPTNPPASPSYHLSRPAHVSVVREVAGIHNFAQYSYNALLCKGILMSPSLQHCPVLVGGVAKIFNSQTHGTPPLLYHFVTAMVLPVF